MDEKSLRSLCREHDIKMTPQRLVIYQEILRSKDHPSTDRVYQRVRKLFPGVSFDTVNRTLLKFVEMGVIRVVEGFGGGRCFEPNMDDHHHLRCVGCGMIIDFYDKACDSIKLPKDLPKNFRILSKKVVLDGWCEDCMSKREVQKK